MKVLGISTSPRKGNSEGLLKALLNGAEKAGAQTELVRIMDINIKPCKGCNFCKAPGNDTCSLKDDMAGIYDKLKEADCVVFASPVYFGRPNGPALSFIDRLYAMVTAEFASRIPGGKKFVSIETCGSNEGDVTNAIHEQLVHAFGFFGMTDAGHIWANQCYALDDFAKNAAKVAEAEELGKKLVQ